MFFKKPAHRSRPNICHFKKYLWASIAREEALLLMLKRLLTQLLNRSTAFSKACPLGHRSSILFGVAAAMLHGRNIFPISNAKIVFIIPATQHGWRAKPRRRRGLVSQNTRGRIGEDKNRMGKTKIELERNIIFQPLRSRSPFPRSRENNSQGKKTSVDRLLLALIFLQALF